MATEVKQEREEPIVTSVDRLGEEAEFVVTELGLLMEHGRELLRRIQDVEAEIEAGEGGREALRHRLLYELRVVRRQLQRAQLVLVSEADERAPVARRQIAWLDDAEAEDRPWRSAEAA